MNPNSILTAFELHRLGLEVGSSAVIGGIVGFAVKKIAKLFLIIVGLELALLQVLELHGVIDVRWNTINGFVATLREAVQRGTPPSDVLVIVSSLSIGGGFVGGFLLGFKRG